MKHFFTAFLFALQVVNFSCNKSVSPNIKLTGAASTITHWKENAHGVIYNNSTNSVAYGKADAKGFFKIFISDTDGNNERQVSYKDWPDNRQQWPEEWDPTGQFLFCYVEKSEIVNEKEHSRIKEDALPGYGAYMDIWLLKRDGSAAWKLTDLPNNYEHGIIHGAISNDGKLFAWTQRVKSPDIMNTNLFAGAYDFKVADVNYDPDPSFTNIRTFRPGNVLAGGEVESIAPDNSNILVYSTFESRSIFATPVYKIDLQTGITTKLTSESFSQCPTYTPDGSKIVYMSGKDAHTFPFQLQGSDWWIMDSDGSNKRRLTFMNAKNNSQSQNKYRLAGTLSFIDDHTFFGDVLTKPLGLNGYTVRVEFH